MAAPIIDSAPNIPAPVFPPPPSLQSAPKAIAPSDEDNMDDDFMDAEDFAAKGHASNMARGGHISDSDEDSSGDEDEGGAGSDDENDLLDQSRSSLNSSKSCVLCFHVLVSVCTVYSPTHLLPCSPGFLV